MLPHINTVTADIYQSWLIRASSTGDTQHEKSTVSRRDCTCNNRNRERILEPQQNKLHPLPSAAQLAFKSHTTILPWA